MIISIVNRAHTIDDAELQRVIRAINRQIAEDFKPYWSFGATLRLEGKIGKSPDRQALPDLRGDAVIYLWDQADVERALGYHNENAPGIPYGFVFTEISKELQEQWSVTLSHESMELLGDARGNLLVQGRHPAYPAVEVFHWFEMCDAVQSQKYDVDGVAVSNFVLPLYFSSGEQEGGRSDFLGTRDTTGETLTSFGVAAGGYVGFYDPRKRGHETYSAPNDAAAARRLQIKATHRFGRGYLRRRIEAPAAGEDAHRQMLLGKPQVKALATQPSDPIKHVVVLMLENRSFDHLLGGLTKVESEIEGVNRIGKSYSNAGSDGKRWAQSPGAAWSLDQKQDPNHEHAAAMEQIGTAEQPMSGFIKSYQQRYANATEQELGQVMAYFEVGDTPEMDTLPALQSLARNFAVCDHWFSSMPGPTWQNRFFVHSGTCLGHIHMPSIGEPQNMNIYYQQTIYDRLSDANVAWKIYHNGIPQSIVMTRLLTRYLTGRGYATMDAFFTDAQGTADDFPEYAFIEPLYFGSSENDQHPPADVRPGESIIADVYNAIRANAELWNSTLLIVTYDEHGGFYDHVYPPAAVPPDQNTSEWSFNQLGVRVPAILVSPWIGRGVIHTVFEHTSILRYLSEKWNLPPLSARMQESAGDLRVNTFGPELAKLQTPRDDTPRQLTPPKMLAATLAIEPPIEGSREALLMYVKGLPDPGGGALAAGGRGSLAETAAGGSSTALPTPDQALDKLQRLRAAETDLRSKEDPPRANDSSSEVQPTR